MGCVRGADGIGLVPATETVRQDVAVGDAAAVPVVSIGNLTVGGTGKTPMVGWIARWFRKRGMR